MNRNQLVHVLVSFPLLVSAGCGGSPQAQEPTHTAELEPVTVTVFGERALLFLEHPPLVRGEPARFLAHFSVLATGEPVRSGVVTLEIGDTSLRVEAPKRDGLFTPEGSIPRSGTFPARIVVASDQVQATLDLGAIVVHESQAAAAKAAEAGAGEDPPGAFGFLLEQQWRIKLLLAEAGPRSIARRLVVPAQVRSPEGAEVVVTPPTAGRLLAPEGGKFPRTGELVEVGQSLGSIEPPLGAADLAQLQSLRLEFDLKSLDIVRALGEAQARLDFATRERERIAKLREHGLSTAQQLDEAERNLAVARSEHEGARTTKESLDRMRAARSDRPGDTPQTVRFPLTSPLRGTVIAAGRLQGESIEPGDELFRILDTTTVWIEASVSEFDLHHVGGSTTAIATFAALPDQRFDVGGASGSQGLRVLPTINSQSRTAILRCELRSADGSIKPGMLAELELAVEKLDAAVTIPLEAVVMDQGLPSAYVMLEGELFQKRDLDLGVKDGALVEVRRGILAGERVATRGAYVVKLAALSPASFGAGHQH